MPQKKKSTTRTKRKTRSTANPDRGKFSLLIFTTAILLIVIMVFYGCAVLLLKTHFPLPISINSPGFSYVQNINYHGYQLPRGFPEELLVGQIGTKLASSQELTDFETYNVNFASFSSRINPDALAGIYQDYLFNNLYLYSAVVWPDRTIEIKAQRGASSLYFSIKPEAEGSLVSVYNRVEK